MNAVTALSGSGPPYVCHFLESLQDGAVSLSFPAAQARELALFVTAGAVHQASQSAEEIATLRERVTSKGGTTEAALNQLNRAGVRKIVVQAIQAAERRARELAIGLGARGTN